MQALFVLWIIVTCIYLILYQSTYWKYFFGLLIPYYLITQIFFCDYKQNTSKKKFFMSTWEHPFDSQIYCSSKVDLTKLKQFLSDYNKKNNTNIGPTVFLIKLVSILFIKFSKLNGNILFGVFVKKKRIDVSVMVGTENGKNYEIITIKDGNKLNLSEIKDKINKKVHNINHGIDVNIGRKKFFMNLLPTYLLTPFLRIINYLSACGVNLNWIGIPKYNFGTAMIVNYGKLGLEDTFMPIFPFSFAPFCIGISKIKKNNKVKIFYTIDHRYLDGSIASKLLQDINNTIDNPERLFNEENWKEYNSKNNTPIQSPKSENSQEKLNFNFEEKDKKKKID